MKKIIAMIMAALLLVQVTGCITIHIGPGESKESSETQTEAPATSEEATPEKSTEEDTTHVPDMFDPTPFIGVWKSDAEDAPYFVFREDFSCRYTETESKDVNLVEGKPGLATYYNHDGDCGFTVEFMGLDGFDTSDLTLDGETLVLKGESVEKRFTKTDLTEDDLYQIVSKRMEALNGIISSIEDGTYFSGQDKAEDTHYGAYFTEAYIDEGILHIHGFLAYYDAEWKEHFLNEEIADYTLTLADDCKVYSSGGDPTTDTEMDASYFNSCFVNYFTGLGVSIEVKNGLVTRIDVGS